MRNVVLLLALLTACGQAPTETMGHPSGPTATRIAGTIDAPDAEGMPVYFGGPELGEADVAYEETLGPDGRFELVLGDPVPNTTTGCGDGEPITLIGAAFTSDEPLDSGDTTQRQTMWVANLRGTDARGKYRIVWIHAPTNVTIPLHGEPFTCGTGTPTRYGPGWMTFRFREGNVVTEGGVGGAWVTTELEY